MSADLDRLAALVLDRCGLTFAGGRQRVLARAVQERLTATGRRDADAYYLLLAADPTGPEWRHLLDALLNNETRFFRDPALFAALKSTVLPGLRLRRGMDSPRELRLWSAGCSTGPEAYSLAMCCRDDDGCRGWDVQVLGTDASRRNLDRAERGAYRPFEVKALPADVLARHFDPLPNGWRVKPEVAASVRFAELDLSDATYPVPAMDVVVCQNVLIYYAPDARAEMVRKLAAVVGSGGYLFLGPADAVGLPTPGLTAVRIDDSWAYHRPV